MKREESLEAAYIEAAILHRTCLEAGDVEESNEAHDRLIEAARGICTREDRGHSILTPMLTHADENVRLWSACHLLLLNETVALAELKRLARSATSRIVQSSAEIIVAEWRKGALDVHWFLRE